MTLLGCGEPLLARRGARQRKSWPQNGATKSCNWLMSNISYGWVSRKIRKLDLSFFFSVDNQYHWYRQMFSDAQLSSPLQLEYWGTDWYNAQPGQAGFTSNCNSIEKLNLHQRRWQRGSFILENVFTSSASIKLLAFISISMLSQLSLLVFVKI